MKTNKTVIVTGGAGFIGSHLVSRLVALGHEVVVIDQSVDNKSFFISQNLHKKITVELMDIGKKTDVMRVLGAYKPSFIFHLAAETIVSASYKDPWKTMQTNIMGTVNILEAARLISCLQGIIVASSDKAYGKSKNTYIEESPLQGDHPYDVSKSSADLIANAYFKTYQLPVAITRFGNVYGEGDLHYDRLIPGICKALVEGKTFIVRSNGLYVRDYLYVQDVVEAYLLLWDRFSKARGQAFNFSSQDNLSVIEVINLAQKSLNRKIPYKIADTAQNEIPYQHLDDQKIRKLGWKNAHSLAELLPGIFSWYKKVLGN